MVDTLKSQQMSVEPVFIPQNNNGIDLVKFICAYLVVSIHIAPVPNSLFGAGPVITFFFQQVFCRIAVPFYFVASGYFLFQKIDINNLNIQIIEDYCCKILRFIGTWSICLVVGHTGHLWYLGATVVGVLALTWCFLRGMKIKWVILLAGLLYCVGLFGDSYYGFIEPLKRVSVFRYLVKLYEHFFYSTRNGIFMGFIYLVMEAAFAKIKIRMNIFAAAAGFVGSLIFLYGEVLLLNKFSVPKDCNMFVFLLPVTFFLFYLASNIVLKENKIYKELRVIGVLVFYLHQFVYHCVERIVNVIGRMINRDCSPYLFIITTVLVTICAIFIDWLSHKEKFKWLKWLYS